MLLIWLSCGLSFGSPPIDPLTQTDDAAKARIAQAVKAAGLEDPDALELQFSFRGVPYRLWLDGRRGVYRREVTDAQGTRVDRLDGDQFTATLDGRTLSLSERDAGGLRRSLNSVAYFALLPRPLQDDAVIARDLGPSQLGGRTWDTLEVRFRAEGGGEDHEDVYRYWIDPQTHRLGYLAYTFATGKGGVRVRKATGYHEVDGVVLVDWANHGREGQGLTIDAAVQALETGELPQLSTVVLEDVEVTRGSTAPE